MTSIQPFLFVNTCCYVCLLHTLNAFCIYCFSVLSVHVRDKDGGGLHVVLKRLSPVFRATISVLYYTCCSKLARDYKAVIK